MVKFSIILFSYNRQTIFIKAVNSLLSQTYRNFEVLLVDNGSNPSIYHSAKKLIDERFKFIRYEENQDLHDTFEKFLDSMEGTHFLFLGDDDALIPDTLKIVACFFENFNDMKILQTGLAFYNHDTCKHSIDSFSGELSSTDGVETVYYHCNAWGIGKKNLFHGPRMGHPSGCFISKKLIEETRRTQGELFVRPFGDVGYLGCCANVEKYYYLDLPLSVIGDSNTRETHGMRPGQRRKFEHLMKYSEFTPLKGTSFVNLAVEGHLKVLKKNNLLEYDCRLRPDFFYNHLRQVASDSPWTVVTMRDLIEVVPKFLISIFKFHSTEYLIKFVNLPMKIFLKLCKYKVSREDSSVFAEYETKQGEFLFADINEFTNWIEKEYLRNYKINCSIADDHPSEEIAHLQR